MLRRTVPGIIALSIVACTDPVSSPSTPNVNPSDALPTMAPLYSVAPGAQAARGEYIVVFREHVANAVGATSSKATLHGATVRFTYTRVLKGFAAALPDAALNALRRDPDIAYIEQDQEVHLTTTQSPVPSWGIDRVDERSLPLSGSYTWNATTTQQSAVRAYIIDTGIQTSHPDFGGRASAVFDAFGGNGQDCNGHGTHVAGTVGGATYGIAKSIKLRAVRVLNCSGSGSNSGVIAGMDWVASNHIAPAVANMSLGGGFSSAVNTSANNLAASGVFLAVAAGNSNANACNFSPASAANATTVAASTSSDAKASYSNYGSCVDLYAPGSSITSDWIGSSTRTISGTSMASPHVAGVGALYKAVNGNASYATIRSWLINNATANVISGNPSGTPNRLLYKSTL
ncbi:MAG: S8 family peptidase [Gemmatimonadaceae bacterium]